MAMAMETATATAMATEMVKVTATIRRQRQCQQWRIDDSNKDNTPGMCLVVVAVAVMLVERRRKEYCSYIASW